MKEDITPGLEEPMLAAGRRGKNFPADVEEVGQQVARGELKGDYSGIKTEELAAYRSYMEGGRYRKEPSMFEQAEVLYLEAQTAGQELTVEDLTNVLPIKPTTAEQYLKRLKRLSAKSLG